jgi:SAM-dependent methyltransferase
MRALSEVRRVLKPGGQFRFFEHVRYGHAFGAFWQDLITPMWRWFGAGCHPNRNVEDFIRQADFNIIQIERPKLYPPLPPSGFIRPHIRGIATL